MSEFQYPDTESMTLAEKAASREYLIGWQDGWKAAVVLSDALVEAHEDEEADAA